MNLFAKQTLRHRKQTYSHQRWEEINYDFGVNIYIVKSLSRVQLFVIPRTVARAPPPMEFSRQQYWSGLPFPSPGDQIFPTRGSNLGLPHCWQMLYHLSHQGISNIHTTIYKINKHQGPTV